MAAGCADFSSGETLLSRLLAVRVVVGSALILMLMRSPPISRSGLVAGWASAKGLLAWARATEVAGDAFMDAGFEDAEVEADGAVLAAIFAASADAATALAGMPAIIRGTRSLLATHGSSRLCGGW